MLFTWGGNKEYYYSKFYRRHPELIVKYNIGFKTLLQRGILEPILYGNSNFSDQFKKIIKHYKKVGYNLSCDSMHALL